MAAALLAASAVGYAQPAACSIRSSGSGARIDEASYVHLGGLDQFVTIRGGGTSAAQAVRSVVMAKRPRT